jgi:hypothetical protein
MDRTGTLSGHEGEQPGRKGAEFLYHWVVRVPYEVYNAISGLKLLFI